MVKRIGVLTPSSNTVLEPAIWRLASASLEEVTPHFSRFAVARIAEDLESAGQFDVAPMLEAARLLGDARVDALLWAGTSGSWLGTERDRQLVQALEADLGVPAATTTLGLVALLRQLGVHSIGLVVPYVDPLRERIVANLAEEGFSCSAVAGWRLTTNFEFASIEPDHIAEAVREAAAPRPGAVVVHCTNLRGAEVADRLAADLGIPVVDSVVVSWWAALRCLTDTAMPGRLPGLLLPVEAAVVEAAQMEQG